MLRKRECVGIENEMREACADMRQIYTLCATELRIDSIRDEYSEGTMEGTLQATRERVSWPISV